MFRHRKRSQRTQTILEQGVKGYIGGETALMYENNVSDFPQEN
jgi:hypothetical protein